MKFVKIKSITLPAVWVAKTFYAVLLTNIAATNTFVKTVVLRTKSIAVEAEVDNVQDVYFNKCPVQKWQPKVADTENATLQLHWLWKWILWSTTTSKWKKRSKKTIFKKWDNFPSWDTFFSIVVFMIHVFFLCVCIMGMYLYLWTIKPLFCIDNRGQKSWSIFLLHWFMNL